MVAMKEPSDAALAVGRLTGWEPLGFEAGDNNWYRFVANEPMGRTDPGGLWAWDGDWIQMGVGGLLGVYGTGVAVAGWSQIDEGAAATIDGLIPVIDPFASYYADECGHISDVYRQSQAWGSTAAVLFTAASGFAAWSVVGGGQFAVGIAAGSAGSWVPHVTYGYGAGGVYTWAHGVGAAGFTTTSFAGPGIVNVTGIPILFPGAVAAWVGTPGTRPDVGNCVYSCGQAFFQGWWPF